jgi:hypothetical protein
MFEDGEDSLRRSTGSCCHSVQVTWPARLGGQPALSPSDVTRLSEDGAILTEDERLSVCLTEDGPASAREPVA